MLAVAVFSRLTSNLLLISVFTLGVMAMLVFGQVRFAAADMFENAQRAALITTGVVVIVTVGYVGATNAARHATPAVRLSGEALAELEAHTVPLEGALLPPDEMHALRPHLEGRRVVAMGEATHGTSEFFELRHSLVRYLVEEMGYRHYGMELSPSDGERLNAYIHGEDVPLPRVLYWPWATEEVVTMLNWMRDYNAAAPPAEELTFHGIDPRSGARDRAMAENTLAILEENGPESRIVIWAHNIHISGREGKAGDYLRRELGDEAYLIGFAFNEGSFNSRTGVVDTFSVGPVPRNHYAYPLAQVSDSPVRFMDLATVAQADEELAAWLTTPQLSRNFAELYHVARVLPAQSHLKAELPVLFDALLYVEQSTPTDVLEAAR